MNFKKIGEKIASTEGTPLHIQSPDGFPLYAKEDPDNPGKWELTADKTEHPVRMFIVSEDSAPFRMRKAELYKRRMSGRGKLRDFTEAEEEDLKTVAAGIVGWENVIWENDAPLDFTDSNVVEFLDGYRKAFDQANAFIGDRANFFTMTKSS